MTYALPPCQLCWESDSGTLVIDVRVDGEPDALYLCHGCEEQVRLGAFDGVELVGGRA